MRYPQVCAALMIVAAPGFAGVVVNPGKGDPPATYCAYDIGKLRGLPAGPKSLEVTAINNRNQIVGWTSLAGGLNPQHAFIWDQKRGMRDLGTVPGHTSLTATDINDAGTVVGDATDLESGESLAFIWTQSRGVRAPDTSLGGVSSLATAINRRGEIVGASQTETGVFHAFRRDTNGDVLDLGAFPDGGGTSSATAINGHGVVIGTRTAGRVLDGFRWDERNGNQSVLVDPALSLFLFPQDIGNSGEVVGDILSGGPGRAFRWTQHEGLQELGTLSGLKTHSATARDINLWGTIVGGSQTTSGQMHGFVWAKQTGMRDLNELIDADSDIPTQAVLGAALGINDAGAIALIGFVPGESSQRGFLLVPQFYPWRGCR